MYGMEELNAYPINSFSASADGLIDITNALMEQNTREVDEMAIGNMGSEFLNQPQQPDNTMQNIMALYQMFAG